MRVWLYSFALFLYRTTLRVVSRFHVKAKKWNDGQNQVWSGLEQVFSKNDRPVAWFHTASMGEFEQARPLIELFRQENPHYFILVTFFSPSGYEVRKASKGIDFVSYLPFDGNKNSQRFMDLVNPKMAIFVKYEYWYFYLSALKKRGVPTVLVSAIFRPSQIFFSWYGGFFREILLLFDQLFVQDASSFDLLRSIGILNSTAAGDTRFDRVLANLKSAEQWDVVTEFLENTEFVVVGSAWQQDMDCIVPIINAKKFPFKWIIVPHEIDALELEKWDLSIEGPVMFSKGEKKVADVLIVNEVGRLSSIYRGATFAFIGGAFGGGLHNTLEAAVFGPTVFFGNKNYLKFKEAVDLIDLGLAFPIASSGELLQGMSDIYDSEDILIKKQVQSRQFVAQNAGATGIIMRYINSRYVQKNQNDIN